jgi:phospholipid/cholesterol/gamma-HCH transport system substrate-binding protein
MAETSTTKTVRVGLLVSIALVVLMVFLFFIGSEQKVFARKHEYEVRLENVSGLAQGNPVRMSGVTIGVIRDITLPRDPRQKEVAIVVMIDRKYAERIRGDSRVRLKKMGLLTGDSFVEVSPGSPRYPALEPGSLIPSQRGTDVEALISSGEDLVENFVQISYSLKNILSRVDRGEGLLGELTTAPETKQRLTDTLLTTLNKTNAALTQIESGKGAVGRLIYDDAYGQQLTASLGTAARSIETVSVNLQRSFESGEGLVPALLSDPAGKTAVYELVGNLRATSANLEAFSGTLQTGEGIVPRLISDRAYGDEVLGEFTLLVRRLNETVDKLNSGEGTAGRLIADPSIYEAVNDILIGINESRMLRWLIRNRQQAGIERRAAEVERLPGTTAAPAPDPPVDAGGPPPEAVDMDVIFAEPPTGTQEPPGSD